MAFTYRPRSADVWDKKANSSAGDFEGFISDQFKVFKPSKGENAIRILPPTFDFDQYDAHFGITISVHYGVGPKRASVLCLQGMKNQKCPLCEAQARCVKLGDEDEAKELKASKRMLVWLLDRNDESLGCLLWPMPITKVHNTICKIAKDKKTGKIYTLDHPDEGYDIYFDMKGEKLTTQYEGFQLDRSPSDVADKHLDYIEKHPLPETLLWRTYDEVRELYEGGADAEPEPEATRRTRRPEPEVETVVRRRRASETNGKGPTEDAPPSRRGRGREQEEAADDPAERRERGRPQAAEADIDDSVPWTDDKVPEQESTAKRLRDRYLNKN